MAHTFPLRVQSGEETALGSHGRAAVFFTLWRARTQANCVRFHQD